MQGRCSARTLIVALHEPYLKIILTKSHFIGQRGLTGEGEQDRRGNLLDGVEVVDLDASVRRQFKIRAMCAAVRLW